MKIRRDILAHLVLMEIKIIGQSLYTLTVYSLKFIYFEKKNSLRLAAYIVI